MKTSCAMWSPIGSGRSFRAILSLRETVILASVAENAIRKDIEDKILWPVRCEHDDSKPRFRWVDVFLLAAVYRNDHLSKKMRKIALDSLENCVAPSYRRSSILMAHMDSDHAIWEKPSELITDCHAMGLGGYLYLDFGRVRDDLTPRVDLYARGLSKTDERSDTFGGEAVFKNTRLPVRHIGKMASNGEPVDSILEDYPYLSEDDITFAKLYAEAHPNIGRPPLRLGETSGGKISPR
jgi:uncharacterized protein (DUF433 family)